MITKVDGSQLTIPAPGSKLTIAGIEATILGVLIRDNSIEYEIAWWSAGDRKTAWVRDSEVSQSEQNMSVGFA